MNKERQDTTAKVALADMHIEKTCKRNTALKQSAETNTGDLKLVMHDRNIPFPSDTAQNYKNVSDRKGTPTLSLKHNKTQMITKLQGNKVEGLTYLCRVDSSTLTIHVCEMVWSQSVFKHISKEFEHGI